MRSNNTNISYYDSYKGRSILNIFICFFILFLSFSFTSIGIVGYLEHEIVWSYIFPLIIGFFLSLGFLSCTYSIIKGENWELSINNNILSWSYPRCPKSKGTLQLQAINKITIRDDSFSNMKIEYINGDIKKVRLAGNNYKLKEFLEKNYKNIEIKFIE